MAEFEILKKGQRLFHADVTVHLEAHVGHRAPRIQISYDILGDDVQCRSLQTIQSYLYSIHFIHDLVFYLVCCGCDDSNGQSEDEGEKAR